jgi:hypothetical protein
MGIEDRDYMKRRSDADDARASSSDSGVEELFSRFLQRHPRFFIYVGVGIGVLVVAALILSKLSGKGH